MLTPASRYISDRLLRHRHSCFDRVCQHPRERSRDELEHRTQLGHRERAADQPLWPVDGDHKLKWFPKGMICMIESCTLHHAVCPRTSAAEVHASPQA